MTTEENNKMIAEFMGYEEQTDPSKRWLNQFFEPKTRERHVYLFFNSSWDWLMPAVEKIENLGYGVTIGMGKYTVIQDDVTEGAIEFTGMEESKIACTYKAVIEFIKWYNENKA